MPNNRWIHNFGQSVKFSAHAALKDVAPTITQTVTDASADLRGMRDTLKYAKRRKEVLNNYLTGDNPELGDQITQAKNNIKKSFKTGKFYQTEEEEMAGVAAAIGGDDAEDMLKMFDEEDEDFANDNPDAANADKSTSIISKELGNTSKKIGLSTMQAAYTTNKAIRGQTSTISSGFMMANSAINELSANIVSVVEIAAKEHSELLTGITNKIDTINSFNTESVSPFFQASINYYNDSLAVFREMNDSIKTLTGGDGSQNNRERSYNNDLLDLINGKEGFKLSNIIKFGALNTRRKANEATMGMGDMLPMMLSMVGGNPMAFALTAAMQAMIPRKISKPLAGLDKSFKNFIPALFGKMGKYNGDSALMNVLGGIFGIDITGGKRKLDLGAYNKSAIPFDGVTKKAIVEVIPTYLSKILQTLEGSNDAYIFNYDKGKFTTANKAQHQFKKSMKEARLSGSSGVMDEIDEYLYRANVGDKNKKLITKSIRDMINQSVKNGSSINYKDTSTFSGVKDDDLKNLIQTVLANGLSNSSQIALLYNTIEEGSAAYSDAIDDFQNSGNLSIFNGMYKNKKKSTSKGSYNKSVSGRNKALQKAAKRSKGNAILKNNLENKKNDTLGYKELANTLPDKEEQKRRGWDIPEGITEEESANGKGGFMNTVAKYANRPIEFVGDVVRGLDSSLHAILFGKKGSVFRNIIVGIQSTFVNTFSWIKNKLLIPLKEGIFGKNIKDSKMYKGISSFVLGERGADGKFTGGILSGLRNEASNIWDETKKAWTENVTPIINEAGNLLAEYIAPSPRGAKGERKPIIDRLYDGLSTGFSNFMGAMFGGNDGKFDSKNFASTSMKELRQRIPKSLAFGGLGAVLGTANGFGAFGLFGQMFLPGGPLGGLVIGSVVGLASQSNMVKDFLFGKQETQSDGSKKRMGGVVSTKMQEWFKAHKVPIVGGAMFGMAKAALVGGTGLVPGIAMAAFGPAIMGSVTGLITKSDTFKDLMFGHEVTDENGTTRRVGGLFNKLSMGRLKKIMPNIGAGALLGMGASSIIGNMGLIGSMIALGPIPSAILGAGLGIAVSSQKMTKHLFGYMDDDGKYHSGVFDRIGNAISIEVLKPFKTWTKRASNDLRHWLVTQVAIPLGKAFYPIKQLMGGIAKNIGNMIHNSFGSIFEGFKGLLGLMLGRTRTVFGTLMGAIGSFSSTLIRGTARLAGIPIKLGVGAISIAGGIGNLYVRNRGRKAGIREPIQASSAGEYLLKLAGRKLNFNNTNDAGVRELNDISKWANNAKSAENERYANTRHELDWEDQVNSVNRRNFSEHGYDNSIEQNAATAERINERTADSRVRRMFASNEYSNNDRNNYVNKSTDKLTAISSKDTPELAVAKTAAQTGQKQLEKQNVVIEKLQNIKDSIDDKKNSIDSKEIKAAEKALKDKTYTLGGSTIGSVMNSARNSVGGKTYEYNMQVKAEKKKQQQADQIYTWNKEDNENTKGIFHYVKKIGSGFMNMLKFLGYGALIFGGVLSLIGLVEKLLRKGPAGTAEDIAYQAEGRRGEILKEGGLKFGIHLGAGIYKAGLRGAEQAKAYKNLAKNNIQTIKSGAKSVKSGAKGAFNFIRHPMQSMRSLGSKAAETGANAIAKTTGENGANVIGNLASKYSISGGASVADKTISIMSKNVGEKVASKAGKAAGNIAETAASNGGIGKVMTALTESKAFKEVAGSKGGKIIGFLTKMLQKLTSGNILKKVGAKLFSGGAHLINGVGRTLSMLSGPIGTGLFAAYDAISGYSDAAYLFNQPEDSLSFKQKLIAAAVNVLWGLPLPIAMGIPMYMLDIGLTLAEVVKDGLWKGTTVETIANFMGINIDAIDHRRATALLIFQVVGSDDEKNTQQMQSTMLNREYDNYVDQAKKNKEKVMKREDWMKKNGKTGGSFLDRISDTIHHPVDTVKGWLGLDNKKGQFAGGGGANLIDTVSSTLQNAKDSAAKVISSGIDSVADALSGAFSFIKKGIIGAIKINTSPIRFALSMFGFDMFLDDNEKKGVAKMQSGIGNIMNWVGEKISNIAEGFGNFVNDALQTMQSIIKAIAEKAGTIVKTGINIVTHPVDSIAKGASWAWTKVKNFFTGSGRGSANRIAHRPTIGSRLGSRRFVGSGADGKSINFPSIDPGSAISNFSKIADNISSVMNGDFTPSKLVNAILNHHSINGGNTNHATGGSVNSGNLEGNAKRIYEFLRQQGYSNTAAAGIMGNLQQEHNFDSSDVGEHVNDDGLTYGGLGIVQWNGSRTQALRQYASEQGKDPEDLDLQLEYMMKEINDSYHGVSQDSLNNLGSPEEVAAKWNEIYEGGTRTDLRQQYANELFAKINGGGFSGGRRRKRSLFRGGDRADDGGNGERGFLNTPISERISNWWNSRGSSDAPTAAEIPMLDENGNDPAYSGPDAASKLPTKEPINYDDLPKGTVYSKNFEFAHPDYYVQNDPAWAKLPLVPGTIHDKGTIGVNGCGILSLTNALINNGDQSNDQANPIALTADLTEDDIQGQAANSGLIGTMHSDNVFSRLASNNSTIPVQPYRGTYDQFRSQLEAGSTFILGGTGGADTPFSSAGHYVYATGLGTREGEGGKLEDITAVIDPLNDRTGLYPLKTLQKISVDTSTNKDPDKQNTPGMAYIVNPQLDNEWANAVAKNDEKSNTKGSGSKNGSSPTGGGERGINALYSYIKLCASEYMNSIYEGRDYKAPTIKQLPDGSFQLGDNSKGGSGNYGSTKEGSALGQQAVDIMRSKIDKVPFDIPGGTSCMKTIGESLPGTKFNGMTYVPNAMNLAKEAGIYHGADYKPSPGDIIISGGDEHVSMFTDKGGVIQNGRSGTYNGEQGGGVYESKLSPEDMFGDGLSGFIGINQMAKGNKAFAGSGRRTFVGSGFGFGRSGNAYNNNIFGMLSQIGVQWAKQRRIAINNKPAERNAFLAMIAKGYRGTDKNDDAWNDLLAGDSGLTSALGIKASESDPRNIGKKPSIVQQIMDKTFGHPTRYEKGKPTNILIAKQAGHAIDWESKAKIMNDAYAQALTQQASGNSEYTDLIMARLRAIVDATQRRADNMTPADRAAVAELRKNGPTLAAKAADASIIWVKIKVGDKVGFVSKKLITLDPNTNTGVISEDGVNFREQPSLSAKVISKLAKGTKVDYEPGDVASIAMGANGKPVEKDLFADKQNAFRLFNVQLKQKLGQPLSEEEEALLNGDSSSINKIFDNGKTDNIDKVLKATTMNATTDKSSTTTKRTFSKNNILKIMNGENVDFAKVAKETEKAVKPESALGTANSIKSTTSSMPSLTSESVLANAIRSLDVHDELHTIIKCLSNLGNGSGNVVVMDSSGNKKIVDTGREHTVRNNGPLIDKIKEIGDTGSRDDGKALSMLKDAIAIAKGGSFRTVKA